MNKRRWLVAATVFAGAISSGPLSVNEAQAQSHDVGARAQARSLIYDWSGFYAGVNFGYGFGANRVEHTFTPAIFGGNHMDSSPEGLIGGGQIGVNWQTGRWVLGLEADAQASGMRDFYCFNQCSPAFALNYSQSQPWIATLRGRLGYTEGASLFYATGGLAATSVKTSLSYTSSGLASAGDFTDTRMGWTAGGGIETVLGNRWSAKLEYLYMDFGRVSHSVPHPTIADAPIVVASDVRAQTVRLGVNYAFAGARNESQGSDGGFFSSRPVHDWSGVYVGGNVGYAAQRSTGDMGYVGFDVDALYRMTPRSLAGGAQIGANWQMNRWVFGVEADYQGTNQRATNCFAFCIQQTIDITQRMSWFATVRARFGYAAGPALFYATGGAAITSVRTDYIAVEGPNSIMSRGSFMDTMPGWTGGGGIETALGGKWSAKVEYLYLDFGKLSHSMPDVIFGGMQTFSINVRDHVFRLGVNYKIGG